MGFQRILLLLVLLASGVAWGATIPLAKVAVSEGYGHFGLIFWQLVISAVVLGAVLLYLRRPLPVKKHHLWIYLFVSLIGTIIPNSTSYAAAVELPAGVMAICIPTFSSSSKASIQENPSGYVQTGLNTRVKYTSILPRFSFKKCGNRKLISKNAKGYSLG